MQQLGQFLLHTAFFTTLAAALVSLLGARFRNGGWIRAGRHGLYASWLLNIAMGLVLLHALWTHDFSNQYVATYTDLDMPRAYILAAFWGGEKGALLFWVIMLSSFSSLAIHTKRDRDPAYIGYTTGILLLAILFFLMLMVVESSPFERFLTHDGPLDGMGMNPQLQNPTMTIHPPALLTGYISFTIPFAFGLGALLAGRLDDEWAKDSRVWTIVCWTFLTIGLILGGMWAYEELGWGGYWAWDPVENAGLIPWFTATAFLHSVMIQERRAMLRRWNFFLVLLTFLLTIFGTFLTRSQLIDSIHAFADSTLAGYFLGYMVVIALVGALALGIRWREMKPSARITHFMSRESFFVLNNILLLGCAFVVLWGTVFSKVSETEAVQGAYNAFVGGWNATWFGDWFGVAEPIHQAIVLGEPWFNRVMVPFGLVLLLLTSLGPMISWRRATRKNFERNFKGPLLVSGVLVSLGAVAWGAWRVAGVRATALVGRRVQWVDEMQRWTTENLLGTGDGMLPSLPLVTWEGAYNSWVDGLGRPDVYAFLAFLFSAMVVSTVSREFVRGARILRRKHGGNLGWNLWLLTLRNRRRHGGYIIHLGVVLTYLAFAGSAFKQELPETVMYPGDRVAIGNYHLTLVDLYHEWEEDGAYVATRAPVVVLGEGDTVPQARTDELADQLSEGGYEPFLVETEYHSPFVRFRFVDDDARDRAHDGVFLDAFFREAFEWVGATGNATQRFRVSQMNIVSVIPPVMHGHMTRIRGHFQAYGDGTRVDARPGSPEIQLVFKTAERSAEFLEAYQGGPVVSGVEAAHFDVETGVAAFVPKGVGNVMLPEVRSYQKHESPTTEVAIDSTLLEDLYLAMRPGMGKPFVSLLVILFPLVSLLWTGALVMVIGGIICLLPSRAASALSGRAPSASAAGWMVALLLGGAASFAPDYALAQHAAPSGEAFLPDTGGAASWDEVDTLLMNGLWCPSARDATEIQRHVTLGACPTEEGAQLRRDLRGRLGKARENAGLAPRKALDFILSGFVSERPNHGNLLRFQEGLHTELMVTTNCHCGCAEVKAVSQCDLGCGNARYWKLRFKELLVQGYSVEDVQQAYLVTRNEMREEGELLWTSEDVRVDSVLGITWAVPFTVISGAVVIFALILRRMRPDQLEDHSGAMVADGEGGESARARVQPTPEERLALEDELDDLI